MKRKSLVVLIMLCVAGAVMTVPAARVTPEAARVAGEALVRARELKGLWHRQGGARAADVVPLMSGVVTAGYVVSMAPGGFVLMRADDALPGWKLMSEGCAFEDLPPGFIEVMRREMEEELTWVAGVKRTETKGIEGVAAAKETRATSAGPLLTLNWNQNDPYNYYAPAASGGPGGRAYAGCVAAAMAMIMRHHQWPAAIVTNYTYTDSGGSCVGTHSASDATLNAYQWGNMPNAISGTSPTAQKQAVGQLMYHCGVTVQMDYEHDGSGAYSESVPGAMSTYFLYNTSAVLNRSLYGNSNWYALIEGDILASRPLYYSFYSGSGGHAVVCDGCRNGNEIHLNFGWGGYATAWYNMDNVNGGGYTWTGHRAVSNIKPKMPLLEVEEVEIESEAGGQYVAPGSSAGMRIWLRNSGGMTAASPEVHVVSASAYLTVMAPGMRTYPDLAAGASASNDVPYEIEVDSMCPAGAHGLKVLMLSGGFAWTNEIAVDVARLPQLVLAATNTPVMEAGDVTWITVSNAGIADLEFAVSELGVFSGSNYTWSAGTATSEPYYAWQDISSVGTALALTDNDGVSGMQELGSAFPLYGGQYTRIAAGANGGIALTNGTFYYVNRALPTTVMNAPTTFLAPLWSDLEPLTGGKVYFYTDDTQSIVTWEDVAVYGTATSETFQAILHSNGEIVYQYKHHSGVAAKTIGIQGGVSPGGPALQIAYNTPFVGAGMAVRITPGEGGYALEIGQGRGTLAPGAAADIELRCAPRGLAEGERAVKLVVQHNDPLAPPAVIETRVVVPEPVTMVWAWVVVWGVRRATRRYAIQAKYTCR